MLFLPTQQRRLACLICWTLMAIGVAALLYGFDVGDVTDAEAVALIESNQALQSGASAGQGSPSGHSMLLAFLHRFWTSTVTPQSARLCSFAAVLLSVLFIDVLLRAHVGVWSASTAGLAMVCSVPAVLLSHTATVDAALMLAVAGLGCSLMQTLLTQSRRGRLGWGLLTVFCLLFGSLAAYGMDVRGSFVKPEDRSVSLFFAIAAACPWALTFAVCTHFAYWRTLTAPERHCSIGALALAALGLALATAAPAQWLAGSMLIVAGASLIAGVCWQRWLVGSLPDLVKGLHERLARVLLLGVPACIAVAGTWRIFVCYNFMERVQAVVVVSLVAFGAGLWLIRKRFLVASWAPLACLLVMCKFAYVHVYLPERDHWWSQRARASAIKREIADDGVLFTPLPVSPAFRYYLDRPVRPLSELPGAEADATYVLIPEDAPPQGDAAAGLHVVRLYEGPVKERLVLWRRGAAVAAKPAATLSK